METNTGPGSIIAAGHARMLGMPKTAERMERLRAKVEAFKAAPEEHRGIKAGWIVNDADVALALLETEKESAGEGARRDADAPYWKGSPVTTAAWTILSSTAVLYALEGRLEPVILLSLALAVPALFLLPRMRKAAEAADGEAELGRAIGSIREGLLKTRKEFAAYSERMKSG